MARDDSQRGGPQGRNVRLTAHGVLLWFLAFSLTSPAWTSEPAALCDAAARRAANVTGVPLTVLRAISLAETGRKRGGEFRAWPWTVNMEGKGIWFDDPAKALAFAEKSFDRGARSFDVGCFQVNYKWHGQNFRSIAEMFQPDQNALYAANFLRELHTEFGDWVKAAGAYHSRTRKYADRYVRRFKRIRANLPPQDRGLAPLSALRMVRTPMTPARSPSPPPVRRLARVNGYPLLQGGEGARGLGSLVPVTTTSGGLFRRAE